MPRILHLADLHLGWRPRDLDAALAEERRRRRDALFERAIDTALAESVEMVVIAGDLFESFDPEPELVERVLSGLERLAAADVSVVSVPGNHDELTYAASVYRTAAARWPGVLVSTPMPAKVATIERSGVPIHVYGVAYVGGVTDVRAATSALPSATGEGTHVFVAHGTLVGAAGSLVAGERSLPLDRDALAAAGYDYVALGHVHVPSTQRLGRSTAVYPGCVGGKGLDDVGSRHWTVVDVGPGRAVVHAVPVDVQPLRHVTLDVTGLAGAEAVEAAVRSLADAHALVRVRLEGALPTALRLDDLTARTRGAFFHLEVRDATTTVSPELLDAWAQAPTVRGAFVRRLRRLLEEADDDASRSRLTRALLQGLDALQERP
jgi:DNA repair protein SbcD/Mre11